MIIEKKVHNAAFQLQNYLIVKKIHCKILQIQVITSKVGMSSRAAKTRVGISRTTATLR